MKQIPLSRGLFAIVDDEDYDAVSKWKWSAVKTRQGYFYATRAFSSERGNRQHTKLHRFLMNPPRRLVVDHWDGNTLDNRRQNLRVCRQVVNSRNQSRHRAGKIIGTVTFLKSRNRYWARLPSNGRIRKSLGTFSLKSEALEALKAHLRKL